MINYVKKASKYLIKEKAAPGIFLLLFLVWFLPSQRIFGYIKIKCDFRRINELLIDV